jgi:hypothetical protein
MQSRTGALYEAQEDAFTNAFDAVFILRTGCQLIIKTGTEEIRGHPDLALHLAKYCPGFSSQDRMGNPQVGRGFRIRLQYGICFAAMSSFARPACVGLQLPL